MTTLVPLLELKAVPKQFVSTLDLAARMSNLFRIRRIRQLVGRVQHFEHPSARRHGALDHVIDPRQGVDRPEQSPPIGAKRQQLADREAAPEQRGYRRRDCTLARCGLSRPRKPHGHQELG